MQVLIADSTLQAFGLSVPSVPLWLGVLGAISGSFREEIWYWLGLITLLAWLGTKLLRQQYPHGGVAWTTNALAAAAFGAQHLSSDFALIGRNPNTGSLAAIIILHHGLAGMVFGWFYWRRGLVATMATHFTADVAISMLNAAVGSW